MSVIRSSCSYVFKTNVFFPFHWKWCTSIMTSPNRCLWSMQYHKLGHERIIDSMLISTVIFQKGLGPILGPWEAIKCHLTRNLHGSNNCNLASCWGFYPKFKRILSLNFNIELPVFNSFYSIVYVVQCALRLHYKEYQTVLFGFLICKGW